jgi:hypothetical protein
LSFFALAKWHAKATGARNFFQGVEEFQFAGIESRS